MDGRAEHEMGREPNGGEDCQPGEEDLHHDGTQERPGEADVEPICDREQGSVLSAAET